MKKLLIDTNIYSYAMKGDTSVISVLQKTQSIGISTITLGELLSGFKGGAREFENRKELDEFLDAPRVKLYEIGEETAEYYADIIDQLRRKGNPIPTNDIWIASVAFQHGLILFTKDKHFKNITGLPLL